MTDDVRDDFLRASLLDVPHGFSLRRGGASEGPYASLNLGLSSGDDPARVAGNRERVLRAFGSSRRQVCAFDQVHGDRVLDGRASWFEHEADAAVTDDPDLLLVVSVADCFPLLFHDPVRRAVGAAHCGWRGSRLGLAGRVVEAMTERYGSRPEDVLVAIGPGIQGACYQVGAEVVEAFAEAGFPAGIARPDAEGRHRLDLVAANRHVLARAGVPGANIESLGACTHCDADRFFSHRRDAGLTGRHWAVVRVEG